MQIMHLVEGAQLDKAPSKLRTASRRSLRPVLCFWVFRRLRGWYIAAETGASRRRLSGAFHSLYCSAFR